jgi:hypothetical protein
MKISSFILCALTCLLLAACHSNKRSISNSAYVEPGKAAHHPNVPTANVSDAAFQYRGELSEFDVLGITRGEITSEEEISRALDHAKHVRLRGNSSILLIQSGAVFPDSPMVTELEKHFRVSAFSGIPPTRGTSQGYDSESFDAETYSRSLRLAAARGGNDIILCYWGIFESETENLATKTVSWVPIANWFVPDQKQHLRIRLKMALVDVRSGDWTVFSPKAFDSAGLSVSPRRGATDQKQVERLKNLAYEEGAKQLVRLYSEVASAR